MQIKNIRLWAIPIIAVLFISLTCREPGDKSADNSNKGDTEIAGHILNLPPMKNNFKNYFELGNIFNPRDISDGKINNERLTRHYNVLTAENNMKPSYLSPEQGIYNFQIADDMVNAALVSGFKVVGHTLLWHSQLPVWQRNLRADSTSRETALDMMKTYITGVVSHFKGRVYKWDVLNEAFPDGGFSFDWKTSMRNDPQNGNPWFIKIGSDFVYEGFLAARLADPAATLYYNDYNLNHNSFNLETLSKTTLVRDMVRDVNQRYAEELPAIKASNPNINLTRTNKLIEGIGLQSHHNTTVTPDSVRKSIEIFRPLGVELSISELDVLGQSYQNFESIGQGTNKHGQTTVTPEGLETQARLYGEYFTIFLENSDIISRVTFWGVSDNESWRSAALPQLFDPENNAKSAYFKVIEALEAYSAK